MSGEKHVPRLPFIRCIVGQCGRRALERHAICGRHMACEVLILGGGGLLIVGGLVAAFIRWGGR